VDHLVSCSQGEAISTVARRRFDVFLSHQNGDKAWATRLKDALRSYGLKVWLDKDEVRPGETIVRALEKGIEESKAVALIVSPEAISSRWVEEEYGRALALAHEKHRPLQLIPVILREAKMPGFLANRNSVDFRDAAAFDENVAKLVYGITGKKPRPAREHSSKRDTGFFDPPSFPDQVLRTALLSRLSDLCDSNPIVSVGGLSGSGKTYLLASFKENNSKYADIRWHYTHENDTLNDLLTRIENEITLTSLATVSKCKELLHILRERNLLLVIDDFHQVDQASYATLINLAANFGEPARLVLISRTYVDLIHSTPRVARLEVAGFGREEMGRFLESRGLRQIRAETLRDLVTKTDGLPLAASLFATLVLDFGHRPSDLLSGNIVNDERFHNWFKTVLSLVGKPESGLLHALSICEGPFNVRVVRTLCDQAERHRADQLFERLQRTYLVQRYSPYRWSVHQLIAMFCISRLSLRERRTLHLKLGRHYLDGLAFREPRILDEEEFFWKIRACKQFQLAGHFRESERILHDVARTINFRGHYELFIQLSANELENHPGRDQWIDYHHAHFCLITGKLKQSLLVIEPLLYRSDEQPVNERLSFARLYADVLGAMGHVQLALQKLRGVMRVIDQAAARPVVRSQAKTTEISLLARLGNYEEAKALCEELLAESLRRDDRIGAAIAQTHGGILARLTGSIDQALVRLNNAAGLFRDGENKRGLAWSLLNLAMCQLDVNDERGAIFNLKECFRIYPAIGECSVDYQESLNAIKPRLAGTSVAQAVNAEIRRVNAALGRRRTSP
jgi:tetratricopeptide (TPR) repeat protein